MSKLKVINKNETVFRDRFEAAKLLADELDEYRGKNPVVLGIPRGGVVMASILAELLEGEMDIVIARKLGAPYNPELAIGALSETGKVYLNERIYNASEAGREYLQMEKKRQEKEIISRKNKYRRHLEKIPLKGRIVIITDDGIATGATMQASLMAAREESPEKLIAAVPVGAEDSLNFLTETADEVVCLNSPYYFAAVGQFYADFAQVSDEEVIEILKKERKK